MTRQDLADAIERTKFDMAEAQATIGKYAGFAERGDAGYIPVVRRARERLTVLGNTLAAQQRQLAAWKEPAASAKTRRAAHAAAVKFDEALAALSAAIPELLAGADSLASELGITDRAYWPAKSLVQRAVSARLFDVLCSKRGLKLEIRKENSAPTIPIAERFAK